MLKSAVNNRLIATLLTVSLLFILSIISSCDDTSEEIDPSLAQLEVHVYGTLSGNPRDNIMVTIHETEQEADDGKNAVTSSKYTDDFGNVLFNNLEPGKRYWVRAKPLIGKSVEQTQELEIGFNEFSIDIL